MWRLDWVVLEQYWLMMMASGAHDALVKLKNEHQQVRENLTKVGHLSIRNTVDDVFKKFLLLSAASYLETEMTDVLTNLYKDNCSGGSVLPTFVKKQALTRKYFTLFEWNAPNANKLFSLFGADFKTYMVSKVKENTDLNESIQAFLELGRLRNEIIHENLAVYTLQKTVDDIFDLYNQARFFVKTLSDEISEYIERVIPK